MAKLVNAYRWATTHKAQIAAFLAVALPLASRYVPGFPADEIQRIVGAFLGA